MKVSTQKVAELSKNPVHTSILWKLQTGRAYTAIELAMEANVSKNAIHAYLTELLQSGLLIEIGRRKRGYYRLLDNNVAQALHDHYRKVGMTENELKENLQPTGMKYCRTCYHHLAGKVGVLLTEKLVQNNFIEIGDDSHFELTTKGESFFKDFEIDADALRKKRSQFAKACIDFSERKYHLGGALGNALFARMEEESWVKRVENSREIKITLKGEEAFAEIFRIEV